MRYTDSIVLTPEHTLATVSWLEDYFRGIGSVDAPRSADTIRFTVEIEGDLWNARGVIDEIVTVLASHGISYEANRYLLKED